ncbi:MAG TPA: sterol desaturase family protein [Burkholderiaceae bacterium]|nr:sterol desaturase family protein [Burkholderiaceae bacterium]
MNALRLLAGAAMATAAVGLFFAEKRRPLRRPTQAEPARTLRNLVMGAGSLAVVGLMQRPLVGPLAERVERKRLGIAQQLPLPAWARDAVAFALLDYTIYVWHVLTHKVPALWRFHLVHHIDMDLDTTTALRFHAVDMALSIPWRAGQVLVCGASPRAMLAWQTFFFVSVLFHHSNLKLPIALERRLVRVLTTPRMHGIHHSAVADETGSNWSSGLSLWDYLHRTARLDVPQDRITIGVPAYRDPSDLRLGPSLALPFVRQRDAWLTQDGRRIGRDPAELQPRALPA